MARLPHIHINVGTKVTILFGAKFNIDKGARGGYLKSDATFPTLLSRIVAVDISLVKYGSLLSDLFGHFFKV